MITRAVILSRIDEVTHLIKWWVSRSDVRFARVREFGEISDFTNDVWCKLLTDFRSEQTSVIATLPTVVCNSCKWTSVSWQRIGNVKTRIRKAQFRATFRNACKLKPWHKIKSHDEMHEQCDARLLQSAIAKNLRSLTWREAVIIRAHFGLFGDEQLTYEQIGMILNISRERVRQIEAGGISKLQKYDRAMTMRAFVDAKHITQKRMDRLAKTEYGKVLLDELMKDNGTNAKGEFDTE